MCYEVRCLCLLRSGELVSLYLVAQTLNLSLRLTFLECAELVSYVLLECIDFALQLTSLVSEGIVGSGESAFHTSIHGVDGTLKRVRLLTDCETVFAAAVAEFAHDGGITVLHCCNDVTLSESEGVSKVTHLHGNVLNSPLQSVNITVNGRSELRDCRSITLYCLHDEVSSGIVVDEVPDVSKSLRRSSSVESSSESVSESTPSEDKQDDNPPCTETVKSVPVVVS